MSRFLAYVLIIAGAASTGAGNWSGAQPIMGARLASVLAPIVMLVCASILERLSVVRGRPVPVVVSLAAITTVCIAGGVISYASLRDLMLSYGMTAVQATLWPVIADGAVLAGSMFLVATTREQRAFEAREAEIPKTPVSGIPLTEVDPDESLAAEMRQWWLDCHRAGNELNSTELGNRFGVTRQRAAARIREVKQALSEATA